MPALTIEFELPTGQYLAHDHHGDAEWPPAPARIAAALLSVAYHRQDPDAVAAARRLFDEPPPVLRTPGVGKRQTASQRWVPVDVEVNPKTGKTGRGGLTGKILKEPERGTVIGDGRCYVSWEPACLEDADLAAIEGLLPHLTYLGRPTSPVIARRVVTAPEGLTTWEPDPEGAIRVRVATPELLTALDERERERDASGITGHHPELATRPTARYRCVPPAESVPPGGVVFAEPVVVNDMVRLLDYYRTPHAMPADLVAVADALGVTEGDGGFVLPVVGTTTSRGLATERLFGVAVYGVPYCERDYVRGRELVSLGMPQASVVGATAMRTVRNAYGLARAWSTVVPVRLTEAGLVDSVKGLEATTGGEIVDASVHAVCRHANGPDVTGHPGLTHVSVLFDRPVNGPIVIGGGALLPFEIESEANSADT